MKKKVIFAVIFLLIGSSITYGAEMILGKSVAYDNNSSGLNSSNVQDAIDELYGKCDATFIGGYWDFSYTGEEQIFMAPTSGTYKLETWGASGGSVSATYYGGYGGYSNGAIDLSKNDIIYINVGGAGAYTSGTTKGGYNGGGNSTPDKTYYTASGGGATHIAKSSGLLSTLSTNKDSILIVSGGGGGASQNEAGTYFGIGGSGGGIVGGSGTSEFNSDYIGGGGTQTAGGKSLVTSGSFGKGGNASTSSTSRGGGGGAGWYGGGSGKSNGAAGGGGSGYIGNSNLTEKSMYCYNCTESEEESAKTISTTCVSETPTENCAKIGNGYARISLIV